jgi:hypothetical protein
MDDSKETAASPKLAENSFRKEVEDAEVSDAEMLHRNQVVMHMRLDAMKTMFARDREGSNESLNELNDLIHRLKDLPDCPARTAALEGAKRQFGIAKDQIEQIKVNPTDEIYLATLTKVLADYEVDKLRHEAIEIITDVEVPNAAEPTAPDGGPVMDDEIEDPDGELGDD